MLHSFLCLNSLNPAVLHSFTVNRCTSPLLCDRKVQLVIQLFIVIIVNILLKVQQRATSAKHLWKHIEGEKCVVMPKENLWFIKDCCFCFICVEPTVSQASMAG